mmetsp:Transcript_95157/g.269356  ORF Transcript_95157/g.269356 Transcript_95157/m.269356 type:complete len:219 (-) Transcript_95157:145-801(-)
MVPEQWCAPGGRTGRSLAAKVCIGLLIASAHAEEEAVAPEANAVRPEYPKLGEILKHMGPSLTCETCMMSMDHFRFEVARRIRGSMGARKKTSIFESRLAIPCAGKRGWPSFMAVTDEGGKEKYVDVHAAAEAKQKLSYKQMGAEVKTNALDACRFFVQGHQKMLLKAILESTGGRSAEINFHRLVCTRKKVCSEADIAGKGGGDADGDDDSSENPEL